MKNKRMTTTWVTTARPGTVIKFGEIQVRVRRVAGGQAIICVVLPSDIQIVKVQGPVSDE